MSGIGRIIFGIVFIALGIFSYRKPDSWFFRPRGSSIDYEPSEGYIGYLKIVGISIGIVGFMILLTGILF
ncbi:hypothetical protein J2Z69_002219 [Paenibacillus shirakamiensis]|uniref:DUF6199 domain-containing protein n=1 Tax=Paenibacillus shirakamiensis TaxID=1265935 RepID=A0ABS4JJK8_9BACL|nr:hypothetical protein [Paenibacillus shirakamiensis]MBP2001176.1 hypothetical protein [Paenibacillus shirakamiensis]